MTLRFLYIDCNSFFASVEQQECPDLRGEPLIVVPLLSDATCAIAASYQAKAYGIKTGTMVGEAKRLCPGLKIVQARHEHYVGYHQRIIDAIDTVMPLHSVASIDEMVCELSPTERDEATARKRADAIKAAIRQHVGAHVTCSIGIAPNRLLAKIATDMHKPNGLTVIAQENAQAMLHALPVSDIPGIGYRMNERLQRHNIHTVGQLWQLAPKHMRAIWKSVAGEQLYYKLRGLEIADAPTTKRVVGHSHVLAPEWRPMPQAYAVAQRLTMKAASRLRRYGMRASYLDLGVKLQSGQRLRFRAQFAAACDNHQIMHALIGLWQEMLGHVSEGQLCKKISITLHGLRGVNEVQLSLFSGSGAHQRQQRMEAISAAMDRLNQRYGRDTVLLGSTAARTGFTGTKIAFSRVPEMAEFHD